MMDSTMYTDPFAASYSIYKDWIFWFVLASVAGVALKFFVAAWYVKSIGNMLGPMFGVREREKSLEERKHEARERQATWGMVLGAVLIVGGLILFLKGSSGSAGSISVPGARLENATPGAVCIVLGVMVIYYTRHKLS